MHAQSRALLTYIRRIYYPFLLHEPAIPKDCPILAAYWAHTQPLLAGMPQAQNSVSVALVIPALAALPLALQEISKHLSAPLLPCPALDRPAAGLHSRERVNLTPWKSHRRSLDATCTCVPEDGLLEWVKGRSTGGLLVRDAGLSAAYMNVGGAWASLPLDTLHVVLTKPGQAGLELSKEAVAELEKAEAAAARFSHAASGEPLVNADPQATATAVVAQLAACMDELQDAGAFSYLSPSPPQCIPDP